jgi:hypothetical protein
MGSMESPRQGLIRLLQFPHAPLCPLMDKLCPSEPGVSTTGSRLRPDIRVVSTAVGRRTNLPWAGVDLILHPETELPDRAEAAVEAGKPPDFVFSILNVRHYERWAYEGRLVDLSEAIGSFADVFDRHALDSVTLVDATTGRRGLYLLPMGFAT